MKWLDDPKFWRNFHGAATIVWILLIIPTILWWRDSIVWIVFMSLWANIASHHAGYVAGRGEVQAAKDRKGENDDSAEPESPSASIPS